MRPELGRSRSLTMKDASRQVPLGRESKGFIDGDLIESFLDLHLDTLEKVHPTPDTLHPTPYTLHPSPQTLHPTPDTLHPKLDSLHHKP